ncbi:MAG TPA: TonB-dependent receptor plug domain-containing protein [Methylocella sp.]|nr:TonB-dependent receptor plug domain-containing protein [Methylocella sp.]
MRALWLFMLVAGLTLEPAAADAAHDRHKTAAKHAPRVLAQSPARQSDGYYVPYVTDAAGRRVPIMQIPSSVTVIPQQLMQDQQDITMCDALRNVSGVFCR